MTDFGLLVARARGGTAVGGETRGGRSRWDGISEAAWSIGSQGQENRERGRKGRTVFSLGGGISL
jgi:hypothetical protein